MQKWIILAGTGIAYAWEAGAIVSGRYPTITQVIHGSRHRPPVKLGVVGGALTISGWLIVHLLISTAIAEAAAELA
jgi:hypothetical protein